MLVNNHIKLFYIKKLIKFMYSNNSLILLILFCIDLFYLFTNIISHLQNHFLINIDDYFI